MSFFLMRFFIFLIVFPQEGKEKSLQYNKTYKEVRSAEFSMKRHGKKEKRGEGIVPAFLCFYFDEEQQDSSIFDISGCQRISFIEDDILL